MLLSSKALPAGETNQYSERKEHMFTVMTRGIIICSLHDDEQPEMNS